MFSDFDSKSNSTEGRGRMGASFALSAVVFGAIAAVVATAVATAHVVRRPRDVDVEFASIPPAPEPMEPEAVAPPPPPPPRARRAGAVSGRTRMGPPTEIPDEQPAEADGALSDEPAGEGDGAFDGPGEGGDEHPAPTPPAPPAPIENPEPPHTAPEQERETVSAPRFLSGCTAPEPPTALNAQAATIRIEVRFLVTTDGRVQGARVVERHELVDDALVLACVNAQRYEPAHLPDGTAVPYPLRRRFVFRPQNL